MSNKNEHYLYYEVHGESEGVPIFVLHGGPGFSHDYLKLSTQVWDKLSQSRPIIFYDQRGTGKSTNNEGDENCTLLDQLNDLESLRIHLGYKQIILLGHSWGGYLGMAYSARYPENVDKLILVGSAAPCFKDTIFLQKYVFPEIQERRDNLSFEVELGNEKVINLDTIEKFSMLFYSPEIKEKMLSNIGNTSYNYEVHKVLRADIEKFDLTPELKKYTHKTLVITGRFDMNVAPLVAYRIHKLITDSEYEVFEYSGHLPFFEEPEKFIDVVNSFISSREVKQGVIK